MVIASGRWRSLAYLATSTVLLAMRLTQAMPQSSSMTGASATAPAPVYIAMHVHLSRGHQDELTVCLQHFRGILQCASARPPGRAQALTLLVIEVGRHGDDSMLDFLAEVVLSGGRGSGLVMIRSTLRPEITPASLVD
jgi:hypothetical protein